MTITSLLSSLGLESWKIFEQSRFDVQSRNAEANHHGAARYLRRDRQGNDKGKTRYLKYKNCLLQNTKRMAHEIYYWRRRNFGRDKIKGTVRPEKLEFDSYKKHFTKFVIGDIFDELEVEGFLRERFYIKRATEFVSLKTRSSLTIPVRCIKRKVLEDMQNNGPQFENAFYFRFIRPGKSRLQKT